MLDMYLNLNVFLLPNSVVQYIGIRGDFVTNSLGISIGSVDIGFGGMY